MKTRLFNTFRASLTLLFSPLGRLPFKWQNKLAEALMSALSRRSAYFHTFHQRPKLARQIEVDAALVPQRRIGIVMQGPLVVADAYTLETVKLYRRTFPGSVIIVSTWLGQDAPSLAALSEVGAVVVQSELPATSGAANVTYQIVSTLAGLRKAGALGVEYALKTRCDQRFFAAGIAPYLMALLDQFPVSGNSRLGFQRRIVGLNINTARFRPYSYSDIFQFGLLSDLLHLWDLPLDTRSINPVQIWSRAGLPKVVEVSKQKIGETYIFITYLERQGYKLDYTLRDHYRILKEQFIVIDKETVDLYCPRFGHTEYGLGADPRYQAWRVHAKINFSDWLTLYRSELDDLILQSEMLGTSEVQA